MSDDAALLRVLSEIQRRGGIGPVAVTEAVVHARQFVVACPEDARSLVDLGSGGGLPGLVIAVDRPLLEIVLVERRATRADLLRFGIRALGVDDRVTVMDADVESVIDGGEIRDVDVVTARSFAPPLVTLSTALCLVRVGGTVLISDPPSGGARWMDVDLDALGAADGGRVGGVHRFARVV